VKCDHFFQEKTINNETILDNYGEVRMSKISKEILDKVPKECEECNGTRIEYWDDISDEHVFRCIDCGMYYPIPKDLEKTFEYPLH